MAEERLTFRGRSFKTAQPTAEAAPNPPAQPAPPASGQYAARLQRARLANRAAVLSRSASCEQLSPPRTRHEEPDDAPTAPPDTHSLHDRGVLVVQDSRRGSVARHPKLSDSERARGPTIASRQLARRRRGAPRSPAPNSTPATRPSLQVAAAMEAEVDRADCREMVRDITLAVLPTRAAKPHARGEGLSVPAALMEAPPPDAGGGDDDSSEEEAPHRSSRPSAETVILRGPHRSSVPSEEAAAGVGVPHRSSVPSEEAAAGVGVPHRSCSPSEEAAAGIGVPHRSCSPSEEAAAGIGVPHRSSSPSEEAAAGVGVAHHSSSSSDEEAAAGAGAPHRSPSPSAAAASSSLTLEAAMVAGRSDMLQELLLLGAHADVVLSNKRTPLGYSIERGALEIAAALLAHGADPNKMDGKGEMALHIAARSGHAEAAHMLLAAGAVPSVQTARGDTALQLAVGDKVRRLLRQAEHGRGTSDGSDENDENDGVGVSPSPPAAATGSGRRGGDDTVLARDVSPPPHPLSPHGEVDHLSADALLRELQLTLGSRERSVKRLLLEARGRRAEVQCDVQRVGSSSHYRCFLRLAGPALRRVCVLEASRSRKGKLANSLYRLQLPEKDPRLAPRAKAPGDDDPLYCGSLRSYSLSGAHFVLYDDGCKPTDRKSAEEAPRRQLAAMVFHKSSSRKAPMSLRVLVPFENAPVDGLPENLLESLQDLPSNGPAPDNTHLLRLVPPRWNDEEQMFQLSYEGRAACMSNKNIQLANVDDSKLAALQVGKLQKNLFNVDLTGCMSVFQAFAVSLAIFDQSSVRRRF